LRFVCGISAKDIIKGDRLFNHLFYYYGPAIVLLRGEIIPENILCVFDHFSL